MLSCWVSRLIIDIISIYVIYLVGHVPLITPRTAYRATPGTLEIYSTPTPPPTPAPAVAHAPNSTIKITQHPPADSATPIATNAQPQSAPNANPAHQTHICIKLTISAMVIVRLDSINTGVVMMEYVGVVPLTA